MRTPAHRAHASTRVALAYGLDPVAATRALPDRLRAKVLRGRGLGVALVTRFDRVRPRGLPLSFGLTIVTCAHAILAEWEEGRQRFSGLCVLRRDVDSRWLGPAGGLVLPGPIHGARFSLRTPPEQIELEVESTDGSVQLELLAEPVPVWPTSSMFQSQREAAEHLGLIGGPFVAPRQPSRLDRYRLHVEGGAVQVLGQERVRDSWFEGRGPLPEGCAQFDCALVARDLTCLWQGRASLASRGLGESLGRSVGSPSIVG